MNQTIFKEPTWITLIKNEAYEINENGQIRNKRTGKSISQRKNGDHLVVALFSEDKKEYHKVDELVANQYVPNPNGYTTVFHKDGDCSNNNVMNLKWVDCINEDYERALENGTVINDSYYTEWEPLIEAPDSYEINKMGQVRNKKNKKLLKGANSQDYLSYSLTIDGKICLRLAHILVAKQYIENPDNKPIVNHLDENKENCCVDNLEWVTAKENSLHGDISSKRDIHKYVPINEYDLSGKYIRTWKSIRSLMRFFGLDEKNSAYLSAMFNKNSEENLKIQFGGRVFIKKTKDDFVDESFVVSDRVKIKYQELNLICDSVPDEFLYHQEDYVLSDIEELEKLLSRRLSSSTKRALRHAIEMMYNKIRTPIDGDGMRK